METNIQELSKQQLKSRETKAKIFRAAKQILKEQGYEAFLSKHMRRGRRIQRQLLPSFQDQGRSSFLLY